MRRIFSRFSFIPTAVVASIVTGLVFFGLSGQSGQNVDQSPVILKEIQELGQLRTVSQHVSRVYDYETHRSPSGWSVSIPFAREIVAASTSNKVLISAEADVQAGVDLSLARVVGDEKQYTIFLPEPLVYEPVVRFKVHNQKRGLFWKDLNITSKAQEGFAEVAEQSSIEGGILEVAKSNAHSQISGLLNEIGHKNIKIVFTANNG